MSQIAELPRTCVPCPKIDDDCYDWYARHEMKLAQVQSQRYDLVFIGDSITHFWTDELEFTYGADVWHKHYDHRKALNLGFGFDRSQNVLWRLEHGELAGQSPRLIVLNIGTNQFSVTDKYSGDSPEDAAAGIQAVIEKLCAMFPEAQLVVMAIFPRCVDKKHYQYKIDATNKILEPYVQKQPNVLFLDLKKQFLNADNTLNTSLFYPCETHLNSAGYQVWADALEPIIQKALGESGTDSATTP